MHVFSPCTKNPAAWCCFPRDAIVLASGTALSQYYQGYKTIVTAIHVQLTLQYNCQIGSMHVNIGLPIVHQTLVC